MFVFTITILPLFPYVLVKWSLINVQLFTEDETACTTDPEGMSYFQIKNENGYVLDRVYDRATGTSSLIFSPNGLKDSQFWYFYRPPFDNNNGYGFIGSKKWFKNRQVLAISLGEDVKDNGKYGNIGCGVSGGIENLIDFLLNFFVIFFFEVEFVL